MKLRVVATKDLATHCHGAPVFVIHVAQACRDFLNEARRQDANNRIWTNPGDFELWHLADYDDNTGQFTDPEAPNGLHEPYRLCTANDAKGLPPITTN